MMKMKIPALLVALSLFSGCKVKQNTGSGGQSAPNGSSVVSAEKTSFDAVTSKLDAGGCFYGYISTEQWLDGISGKIGEFRGVLDTIPNMSENDRKNVSQIFTAITNLVKVSGIEDVSGVGMSSIAREANLYYNKIIVHHYPGKNSGLLWNVVGKTPHSLDALDLLPKNTALAAFSDLDLPLVWSTIQDAVNQLNNPQLSQQFAMFPAMFEKQTKLKFNDVLASLGGEVGVIVTLDQDKAPVGIPIDGGQNMIEFPVPAIALLVKVKNDTIWDVANKNMNNPQVIKVDTSNLKMRTQPVPLPLPIPLRPTVARSGDYLIVASTDELVKEIVDVKAGKTKGWKSSDQFKRLSQGVPLKGNSFAYVDHALGEAWTDIQKNTMLKNSGMPEGMRDWLAKLLAANQSQDAFTVRAVTADGVEITGNASKSLKQVVLLPAVAVPAVAAGMVLPALAKAKERATQINQRNAARGGQTSQYNRIINNLRQIDGAKQQWALEKQKSATDVPTEADLQPYLAGNGAMRPVVGEKYTINAVGKSPTATAPVDLNGHPAGSIISVDNN